MFMKFMIPWISTHKVCSAHREATNCVPISACLSVGCVLSVIKNFMVEI